MSDSKVGFIGTGIMGRPMAGHLQAGGCELFLVQNRTPLPRDLLAAGAHVCGSPREVAMAADVVITMLPDTPDVERVLFGADGVATGLSGGKCIVDMSSVDPIATRHFARKIQDLDCDFVDAPVSGGEIGARNAALTIMCGGTQQAFERIRPLLEKLGKNITLVGGPGDGQVAKVANQIIVALTIGAVAEALTFATKAGADPVRVREALMGGFAGSRVLDVHAQRMIDRSFAPGFRIALHQKDLGLALNSARALQMALPQTALVQQFFSACIGEGYGDLDHSALVSAIEKLANMAKSVA